MNKGYRWTVNACFIGYIIQAIVNNFVPLLFLTFQSSYGIPLSRITLLITVNFAVQLMVDLASVSFVDRIGYRVSLLIAHAASALGLVGLVILPRVLPDAYAGLFVSVVCYAVGGGLLEVLVSPVMESCPTKNKEKAMSMLHSFYCWGHVLVILCSTAFFAVFGLENWRVMACLWAAIPLLNFFYFCQVPVPTPVEEGKGMKLRELIGAGVFWRLFLMMLCAGASEQGMSQWASAFAEASLHIPKTAGDLLGPCAFAVMMGLSRLFFGKCGDKIKLERFLNLSSLLCVASYLLAALFDQPALCLLGCMLCGLSVGIMWPGCFSIASKKLKNGGTAMFALLALAGDVGCAAGPALVGNVAELFGGELQAGLLAAVIFPTLLLLCNLLRKKQKPNANNP